MSREILGNTLEGWLLAAGIVVAALAFVTLLRTSLVRRLESISARTDTAIDDYLIVLLKSLRPTLVVLAALAWSLLSLDLPAGWVLAGKWLFVVAIVVQLFRWVNKTVDFWVRRYEASHQTAVDRAAISIISFGVRLAFWVLIGLEVLRYFHKSPTTLLAGLGVGGIALALAIQNVLGDLLAALSILLDKPFVVGDTVAVDTLEGVVERIGLKTTRLRAPTGELLIFGNADLMRSRMRNLSRRTARRVTIALTVHPGTPSTMLATIPAMLRGHAAAIEHVHPVRSHLTAVTPRGIEFEMVCDIHSAMGEVAFDARQRILLGVLADFERSGIRLAQIAPDVATTTAAPQLSGDLP